MLQQIIFVVVSSYSTVLYVKKQLDTEQKGSPQPQTHKSNKLLILLGWFMFIQKTLKSSFCLPWRPGGSPASAPSPSCWRGERPGSAAHCPQSCWHPSALDCCCLLGAVDFQESASYGSFKINFSFRVLKCTLKFSYNVYFGGAWNNTLWA